MKTLLSEDPARASFPQVHSSAKNGFEKTREVCSCISSYFIQQTPWTQRLCHLQYRNEDACEVW